MTTLTVRRRGRLALGSLALTASLGLVLSGCTPSGPADAPEADAPEAPSATVEGLEPIAERPVPTEASAEPVRIAMIGFANNPYWVVVQDGADAANEVLAGYNGSVEYIVAGDNIDVATVDAAIRGAVTLDYDGIGFFIAGEGNCEIVAELSEEGISLGAYNTLFDCLEEAGAVANYAQEQFKAGKNAAAELIAAVGDEGGTVGIITSKFTAPGAEQRRTGFIEGLEGSNLTLLGEGVEANDSASESFTAAQNYIQSADDLVAIYATAGGPFGAAEAVAAAGLEDQIRVVGYDITEENIAALENGSMWGVTGQDAFGQGYNLAIHLFNAIVTGEKPSPVLQEAESPFVTLDTLADHNPANLPRGKLGAS